MYIPQTELFEEKENYAPESIDALIQSNVPAFEISEVLKFLAWGFVEGQDGAQYFARKFGLSKLHLMAFRSDDEFKKELESAREPCFA
jgi:hypothetical protein